mgnify:CR=1 FL=1
MGWRYTVSSGQPPTGIFAAPRVERVHYGPGCLAGLPAEVDRLEASRVLVITGHTLIAEGKLLHRVRDLLGGRCVGVFGETRQHVPRPSVLAAARAAQEAEADLLISFGGGTPIDTAKLVALCLAENITEADQLDNFRIIFQYPDKVEVPAVRGPCLPHISISTTLSAGEFTNFAGATDEARGVKDLYTGEGLWASAAFLDPEVTVATPGWLWASTGIRAVDHAVETVCSRSAVPFADALALESLRLLFQHLPVATSDRQDLAAAAYCQLAAWMSIYSLTNVQVGLSHGLGHQLGARSNVPHGVTSCIMLPRVMEFNRPVTARQQRRIAEAVGVDTRRLSDESAAIAAVEELERLIDRLGIPRRLRDWGVSEKDLAAIARDALEDLVVATNPRPITSPEELVDLLHRAL